MFDDTIFGNPEISPDSFVISRASVIGRVTIEADVIVAPSASIRADEGAPFRICKGTNIQDGVTLHGLHEKYVEVDGKAYSIYIGSHCSIAHGALIHGPCIIGKKTFVGFKSMIHNSMIGRNCHIGFGAIIRDVKIGDDRYIPDGAVINHQKAADELPRAPEDKKEFNKEVVDFNKSLVKEYRKRRELREKE